MIDNLEYINVKVERLDNDGNVLLQGTGVILLSNEEYYLLTACHCIRRFKDKVEEIPMDWRMVRATAYLPDTEVSINITGLHDLDFDLDWVILCIDNPSIGFDYSEIKLTEAPYELSDTFNSYAYPKFLPDGKLLSFVPNNKRGEYWTLIDNVGDLKALTAEKGISGAGIFKKTHDSYLCHGIFDESAEKGAYQAMHVIRPKYYCHHFPDISVDVKEQVHENHTTIPTSDEALQMFSQEHNNPQTGQIDQIQANTASEFYVNGVNSFNHGVQFTDRILLILFEQASFLCDFDSAYAIMERLYSRHKDDEWALLNYLQTIAMIRPEELQDWSDKAISLNCSTPESTIFLARVFAHNGYPETAVTILYNNAMRLNSSVLDSLYVVETLNPQLRAITHQELDVVCDGECVIYEDEKKNRHCWLVQEASELGKAIIGHIKNDVVSVNLGGDVRDITIIKAVAKYYFICSRAYNDVAEHGDNGIMKMVKLPGNENNEINPDDLLNFFKSLGAERPTLEQLYEEEPWLMKWMDPDDILGYYYNCLFGDFPRKALPEEYRDPKRFTSINSSTQFELDMSGLIVLFEHYSRTGAIPKRKFVIPAITKVLIADYHKRYMSIMSHKFIQANTNENLVRYTEDVINNMEIRLTALEDWIEKYCIIKYPYLSLNMAAPSINVKLSNQTLTLIYENPNTVLISSDWYIVPLFKKDIWLITPEEYISNNL